MKILYLPNEYSQQRQREKARWIYPVLLAMQAQHYRNLGYEVVWDRPCDDMDKIVVEPEDINFENLPAPDRVFTNAYNRKYQDNGNFKYLPGTYIQVADGCWHGKCSFCVENKKTWRVRPVWDVQQELWEIHRLGFKEVFDDSGTFPVGKWLDTFLSFPNPGIVMGCNMRMVDAPYKKMKEWGFRMVLFGLESANQKTLDRINKGVKVEDFKYIKKAARAGLEPHVAVMFGYPWETESDAKRTLAQVHYLLRKGYAKTAQASFYTPPFGDSKGEHRKYVGRVYADPRFWIRKIQDIKDGSDISYILRQIKKGIFHG